jgi:hypothetical protein
LSYAAEHSASSQNGNTAWALGTFSLSALVNDGHQVSHYIIHVNGTKISVPLFKEKEKTVK